MPISAVYSTGQQGISMVINNEVWRKEQHLSGISQVDFRHSNTIPTNITTLHLHKIDVNPKKRINRVLLIHMKTNLNYHIKTHIKIDGISQDSSLVLSISKCLHSFFL